MLRFVESTYVRFTRATEPAPVLVPQDREYIFPIQFPAFMFGRSYNYPSTSKNSSDLWDQQRDIFPAKFDGIMTGTLRAKTLTAQHVPNYTYEAPLPVVGVRQ